MVFKLYSPNKSIRELRNCLNSFNDFIKILEAHRLAAFNYGRICCDGCFLSFCWHMSLWKRGHFAVWLYKCVNVWTFLSPLYAEASSVTAYYFWSDWPLRSHLLTLWSQLCWLFPVVFSLFSHTDVDHISSVYCWSVLPAVGPVLNLRSQSAGLSQRTNSPIGLEMLTESRWWRGNHIKNSRAPLAYSAASQ